MLRRRHFYRWVFILAGIYNLAWGLWSSLDPQWFFRFTGLAPLNHPAIRPVAVEVAADCLPGRRRTRRLGALSGDKQRLRRPDGIAMVASDFAAGGLRVASFARPGKLFTASAGLIVRSVGVLTPESSGRLLAEVAALFRPVDSDA